MHLRVLARDVVAPEWTMANGMVTVPVDVPGIGVAVDVDRVVAAAARAVAAEAAPAVAPAVESAERYSAVAAEVRPARHPAIIPFHDPAATQG